MSSDAALEFFLPADDGPVHSVVPVPAPTRPSEPAAASTPGLTVREAAKLLGIPFPHAYDLVESGDLLVTRVKRELRVKPEEIERILCKGATGVRI